jgi:hypothetical protein
MTKEDTTSKLLVKLSAGVCLATIFILAGVAYVTAFPLRTVTDHPNQLLMFLPGLILFGWGGMPGNFFHNVGLPPTLFVGHEFWGFVRGWAMIIAYWIVFGSLITLSLTKRHVITLVAFAVVLMLSAHGCQSNIKL